MESVLSRTGSGSINSPLLHVPPHGSFSSCQKLKVNNTRRRISRAISEPRAIIRLRSIPKDLPEVEKCFDRRSWFPATEGVGGDGFGSGSGRSSGGSNNNDNDNDNENELNKIGAHYKKMLKTNPNNPLLLRNYSKYLDQVEGDTVKAEEYYGRAILANPGDGELLSLYGNLIWDTQRDGERARSYFDQAVIASPDDCLVMGSYAQFMWEADEDEDDEEKEDSGSKVLDLASQALVAAF